MVLQLLCVLMGADAQMPRSAGQYRAAVYLLALRVGVPNSKSSIPAIADMSTAEDAASENAALVCSCLTAGLVCMLNVAAMQDSKVAMPEGGGILPQEVFVGFERLVAPKGIDLFLLDIVR